MLVNLQRKIQLDIKPFQKFVSELSTEIREARESDFSVAFVSDRRMKELNRFFRDKASTTDVLSFPHEADEFESHEVLTPEGVTHTFSADEFESGEILPREGVTLTFLGDIVISVEQAQKQAAENGLTLENEIKQLILHGLLHLCGYDHEADQGEMNKRELELRAQLRI